MSHLPSATEWAARAAMSSQICLAAMQENHHLENESRRQRAPHHETAHGCVALSVQDVHCNYRRPPCKSRQGGSWVSEASGSTSEMYVEDHCLNQVENHCLNQKLHC